MRPRALFLLLAFVLLGAFGALNRDALTARATLNLLVARVEAPLGLALLAVTAVLATLLEAGALIEARRYAREILAQRQLAEAAEGSRYTELRRYLDGELAALRARLG